ncbi:Hsp20/alpha crystallin family protein [Neobacillus novalis]|uniref:Hsp20/alpha crystallin family protein n=1 Tax=Neobacillus novalis TaxID=220687 RepID=A0AA95SEG0_9BACI|nr:Hsp20/alpha crystallin family protein [Neobacillus novalis]WHY84296.1 Hsp20/alpha crystallin family protein [Neobacillus novalis]
MEIDRLKKWMETAQQYQSEKFWNNVFDSQNKSSPSLNPIKTVSELFPKCDLYETENELVVEAEIPGVLKENLHISIHHHLLTVTGEYKTLVQNRKYFIKERPNRKFTKEITLPYPVNIQKVKSEMRYGVLSIVMPINREKIEDIPITFNRE